MSMASGAMHKCPPDAQGQGVGPLVEAAMVELQGGVVQVHAVDELAVLLVVPALVVLEHGQVLQDAVLHVAHIVCGHLHSQLTC